jgi:hypothetical protein
VGISNKFVVSNFISHRICSDKTVKNFFVDIFSRVLLGSRRFFISKFHTCLAAVEKLSVRGNCVFIFVTHRTYFTSSSTSPCQISQLMMIFLLRQVGDIIVDNLVQSRDLDKILRSAKLGGIKERRNAAFEMVSLVASNTETKTAVVDEGGYVPRVLLLA